MRLATKLQADDDSLPAPIPEHPEATNLPYASMKTIIAQQKMARLKARNILRLLPGLRMMLFGIGM